MHADATRQARRRDGSIHDHQLGRYDQPVEAPCIERRAARGFVRWLLATTLALVLAVAAVNLWLDPVGATGRQTRFSAVENAGVRQAKLDLLEALDAPPDVLVLGSSRSRTIDPADIERATGGRTAFNAAVSGGTTRDTWLYTKWVRARWGRERFPHLVIGVVNDVFRDAPGSAALDPRLKALVPTGEERGATVRGAADAAVQLATLEAGVRAARRVVARDGLGALLHPEQGGEVDDAASFAEPATMGTAEHPRFDADGMQLFEPGDQSRPLRERVDVQMRSYVQRAYVTDAAFTGIDARGADYFRRTIRIANDAGDVPTVWITPFQPRAKRLLPEAHAARDRRFREFLRDLQDTDGMRFHVVDLSDVDDFGGTATDWYDGIHMQPANTRRVVERLEELGELG